ncbi:MAG: zinc carboxypeptidase, partial [Micromonosporaceae bacterium]
EYVINYHSAAELLLYGTGWQVSTPQPDDIVYEALAGDDEHPGVPGYDPDLSAELYTTNGETTEHLHHAYGTLAFTPEMSTCQTASRVDPDDEWLPEDCASVFNFPEDEALIQAEYEKNIEFARNVAMATHHPDSPEGAGGTTPDFVVDAFDVSHSGTGAQPVAVNARRALEQKKLHYKINGGATKSTRIKEWGGGEKYGDHNDVHFAEYRGNVKGAKPGDSVEVWFSALKPGTGLISSEHFTYDVSGDTGGDVLILAAEDVTGALPTQDGTEAKYVSYYADALTAAGYSSDVYDIDVNDRKAPHHLGVLSHYDAVVWETGDDIIPRNPGQGAGTAAKVALDTELTIRDYLNEGGKLLAAGQFNGLAQGADGVYYYNPYEPPSCTARTYPCLPLFNDFQTYYLGAYTYVDDGGTSDTGPYPVKGTDGAFAGFEGTLNGGDSADNQGHTASFLSTSSFLPPSQFPQFGSAAPVAWDRPGGAPYDPRTGAYYLNSQSADRGYKRATRTIDLTGASSGKLEFWTSYDLETDWDYQFVEAHTVGQDDWTTLPDANGHTGQGTGDSCQSGWVDAIHPHLGHYMDADCAPTGTTGAWHAATGSSGGWQKWSIDLSAYAGKQVEVSITYATDWGTLKLGTFLDDTTVIVDGAPVAETSFESDLGGWAVPGAPAGSPGNGNDWVRSTAAFEEGAGVVTEDTVYVGFGIEGLTTAEQRNSFVKRSMQHLLG